jgi:hypothetical protein
MNVDHRLIGHLLTAGLFVPLLGTVAAQNPVFGARVAGLPPLAASAFAVGLVSWVVVMATASPHTPPARE